MSNANYSKHLRALRTVDLGEEFDSLSHWLDVAWNADPPYSVRQVQGVIRSLVLISLGQTSLLPTIAWEAPHLIWSIANAKDEDGPWYGRDLLLETLQTVWLKSSVPTEQWLELALPVSQILRKVKDSDESETWTGPILANWYPAILSRCERACNRRSFPSARLSGFFPMLVTIADWLYESADCSFKKSIGVGIDQLKGILHFLDRRFSRLSTVKGYQRTMRHIERRIRRLMYALKSPESI